MSADLIEWGVASLALPGQTDSGDLYVVAPFPNGVLAAVIDGLGHGSEASLAARVAADTLADRPHESVIALAQRCHQRLHGTRGAVMSLASFDALDGSMTWLAVGNVEGVLLRAGAGGPEKEGVLLRGGVIGYQLPPLRASALPVARGDTLILATDGIRSDFADALPLGAPPQHIADHVLGGFATGTDDALVLVARYRGNAP